MAAESDVTILLQRLAKGDDPAARSALYDRVYDELRQIAQRVVGRASRPDDSLNASSLVHEAYLKLVGHDQQVFQNRLNFFKLAAAAMRSVLVDRARNRAADKRGGGRERLSLDIAVDLADVRDQDVLALHEALEELGRTMEPVARIVELRFFGGLTNEEVAAATGMSLRTVERGWRTARDWLAERLGEGAPASGDLAPS